MGKWKGRAVDGTGEVVGLVIISVVSSSAVGSMVVGSGASVVTTGVVVSMDMVVATGVG